MAKKNNARNKARRGKQFEKEISESLSHFEKTNDIWWRRIPDFRSWHQLNKNLHKPRVPGDFEAMHNGKFFMLEAKSTISNNYNMQWIKAHQKQSLLEIDENGGYGFILFSKRGRPVKVRAIRIQHWLELEHIFKQLGRKSIPTEAILEYGLVLPRLKGSKIDFTPLFDYTEDTIYFHPDSVKLNKKRKSRSKSKKS